MNTSLARMMKLIDKENEVTARLIVAGTSRGNSRGRSMKEKENRSSTRDRPVSHSWKVIPSASRATHIFVRLRVSSRSPRERQIPRDYLGCRRDVPGMARLSSARLSAGSRGAFDLEPSKKRITEDHPRMWKFTASPEKLARLCDGICVCVGLLMRNAVRALPSTSCARVRIFRKSVRLMSILSRSIDHITSGSGIFMLRGREGRIFKRETVLNNESFSLINFIMKRTVFQIKVSRKYKPYIESFYILHFFDRCIFFFFYTKSSIFSIVPQITDRPVQVFRDKIKWFKIEVRWREGKRVGSREVWFCRSGIVGNTAFFSRGPSPTIRVGSANRR